MSAALWGYTYVGWSRGSEVEYAPIWDQFFHFHVDLQNIGHVYQNFRRTPFSFETPGSAIDIPVLSHAHRAKSAATSTEK